ncbi:hypothetical protein BaRGS_00032318 [Batillaria attramentaria]|uniref:Uncharacterized protein n=1 Tax=Batillaria attramentaria TaxID=370345 RepID=A0ABD0JGR0_9CAEN
MIRVGARAPAPPPIASPKGRPTLNRDHVTGGRLVRVRQSGDLRDRVVQLARRKEERNENHIPTCTSGSQPQGCGHLLNLLSLRLTVQFCSKRRFSYLCFRGFLPVLLISVFDVVGNLRNEKLKRHAPGCGVKCTG